MTEKNRAEELECTSMDETIYHAPYVVKDGCLYETVVVKEQTVHMKLADFVPMLVSEITHDDGTEQKKLFRVRGVHRSGTVLPEVLVSSDEMQTMKWMLNRWGTLAAAQPKHNVLHKICHAILSTKQTVRFETVYLQTGWKKIDGNYVFLMPDASEHLTVELQGNLRHYGFVKPCPPDQLFYLAAMLDHSFAPQRVLLPLLAVTFLSPLNHFLKAAGCEPKFVTALIGRTGSRKSTLAALFLSFFGSFTASELPMSFHDTGNSILANIYYLKDVLTCIDDFHPSGRFHEQDMKQTAQNISRFYGDRIGRARLNSKAELQSSRPPTGNAIITAEYIPELSASGCARYFNIELNEHEVQLDLLSEYQQLASEHILSGIMQRYTDWLGEKFASDEGSFTGMLSEKFLRYRRMYMAVLTERAVKFHNRTPDMLAHLRIGFVFLLAFLNACEQLSTQDCAELKKVFDSIVLDTVAANAEVIAQEHPTAKFAEKLQSLLDSGRCYVETKGVESSPRTKNCIGLQDNQYFYLFADAAHSEVRRLCAEQGEHFTISKNELLRELRKEGILTARSSRNTVSIRDNANHVVNVTMLDKERLAAFLN